MTPPTEKQLQTGFTPLPGAQERIWNKLSCAAPLPGTRHFSPRWAVAVAAACFLLAAFWTATYSFRPEYSPMTAKPGWAAVSENQRFGEAGPRGLEYHANYVPFR